MKWLALFVTIDQGYSLHQVLHESLQRDIISEDGLCTYTSTITSGGMSRRRVKLGKQETCLRATGIANNEAGEWETVRNKFLPQN